MGLALSSLLFDCPSWRDSKKGWSSELRGREMLSPFGDYVDLLTREVGKKYLHVAQWTLPCIYCSGHLATNLVSFLLPGESNKAVSN